MPALLSDTKDADISAFNVANGYNMRMLKSLIGREDLLSDSVAENRGDF